MSDERAKKNFLRKVRDFFGKTFSARGRSSAMSMAVCDVQNSVGTRFVDVAGNEEAKESVADVVDFIKNPAKYERFGAKMPRGVIFCGPPGTGKTLMARAVAGEAGVPFYAVNGSDFVQMYVGVGAARVRDLFKKARANGGKAVVFIDEIDALGKKRTAGSGGGGGDEREQTLNALLTEMQGFSNAEGVIVIAATNRADTLDEALLRPGRFDRQVMVNLPDYAARRDILGLYARNKPLSPDVDLDDVARQTVRFSGAQLENLLNEAAISAAKRCEGEGSITNRDIDAAFCSAMLGGEKKRQTAGAAERRLAAFHEAGHAIAAKTLLPDNRVAKVTILQSAGGAGGFCMNVSPERNYCTKSELFGQAVTALAGRAAEELTFGEGAVTTGASNDIEKCVKIAEDYITKYGFQGLGAAAADSKPQQAELIERAYETAKKLLSEKADKLKALAAKLLEKETLNERDIDAVLA